MYYPLSYLWHFLLQTSIFVYNFYSGVNFCGKKNCGNFILWELIFADREKKKCKHLVPHGKAKSLKYNRQSFQLSKMTKFLSFAFTVLFTPTIIIIPRGCNVYEVRKNHCSGVILPSWLYLQCHIQQIGLE